MGRRKKSKPNSNYLPNSFHQNFSGYVTNTIPERDIQKLKNNKQPRGGNTVTDFTSWIYDSIIPERNYSQNIKDGKEGEKRVYEEIVDNIDKSDDYFRRHYKGFLDNDWILEYEDLSDEKKKTYKISRLKFNNNPIFGKPDIVYRNRKTNDRIIIEVKSTNYYTNIPFGGWYNLQCQLWSYSHIDEFKDSNNIFLMGDIRIKRFNKRRVLYFYEKKIEYPPEYLYSHSGIYPRWRFIKEGKVNTNHENVNKFHEQCKMIFQIYGGEYVDL
jgi:hypothetical protein